jgi:hypothetical protein
MTREDYRRYFVKYLDGQPMGTMSIVHEVTWYDEESEENFDHVVPLLPYQKEMCKILLEQGWTETDFITETAAHSAILDSVKKPGDDNRDAGLWRRQGEELQRREKLAGCINYPDLLNLAKKRLGMKYYMSDGKSVPAAKKTGGA